MSFPNEIIDIDKTKYLSSIGLMKACDKLQIINYLNPWEIKIDWNKCLTEGKDGCWIYVKFGNIQEFIQMLDIINFKFILITGDGDETMPYSLMDINTFYNIVNNNKIIKWYSVNCLETLHPKFSLIPIGLNYHCDALWNNVSIINQENMLETIRLKALPFNNRICKSKTKCYK